MTVTSPASLPPDANAPPLLEVRGASKSFPGVRALEGVSLTVNRGEVLAVVGENGAGKSTLMKVLAGVQSPDSGEVLLDGRPVALNSVHAALSAGIVLIHQELNLAENLDVGANIYLGREPRRFGFVDKGRVYAQAREVMGRLGLDLSPRALVGNLSIGHQQMVEIAKALSVNARVLIMDEPTSSLSRHEADRLFAVVRDLKARGMAIVYISHRLGEVKQIADRVVVLRDGRNAGELAREEVTHARMVKLMVGRDVSQFYQRKPHPPGPLALEAIGLRTPSHPRHPLTFALRAGEIVGVAGLVGAGRTEVLETLFGVTPAVGGELRVAGEAMRVDSPQSAVRAGIALVPEDRKQQGLILEMSLRENASLPSLGRTSRGPFLNFGGERAIAARTIKELAVRTPGDRQVMQYLSGGNQQKVVLGKWLATRPRVLLLDEPTRGVDVGAKHEIYRLMDQLAATGVAVLFVSSEMEEVLGMSDRVLVMHEGRITGELARPELSEEAVMRHATGTGAAGEGEKEKA